MSHKPPLHSNNCTRPKGLWEIQVTPSEAIHVQDGGGEYKINAFISCTTNSLHRDPEVNWTGEVVSRSRKRRARGVTRIPANLFICDKPLFSYSKMARPRNSYCWSLVPVSVLVVVFYSELVERYVPVRVEPHSRGNWTCHSTEELFEPA